MDLRIQRDRLARRHTAKARKNLLTGKALHLVREGGHEILDEHNVISMLMRRSGGRFHTQIGGDSAEHDGCNITSP